MDVPDSLPTDQFLMAQIQTSSLQNPYGIVKKKTHLFSEFQLLEKRLESFKETSFDVEKVKNLAIAGFYYLEPVSNGYKDCAKVRCFCCGLKLITNRGHHALAYHAFVSPGCHYLQIIIPTFRLNNAFHKFQEFKRFTPLNSNQLLASDLLTEHEDENLPCVVCLARNTQVMLLPCQHFKLCRMCSVPLTQCPICRQQILALVFPLK